MAISPRAEPAPSPVSAKAECSPRSSIANTHTPTNSILFMIPLLGPQISPHLSSSSPPHGISPRPLFRELVRLLGVLVVVHGERDVDGREHRENECLDHAYERSEDI